MDKLEAGDLQQAGPYSLIGKWGTAGAGEIFVGRSDDGRVVLVTVVKPEVAAAPEFRERFRARVEAARAVSGDFIAPMVDADPDAQPPWSATAFVRGLPLRRAVNRYGRLAEPALRKVVAGLAQAMTRIHADGLIHADVGPDSVLLTVNGPCISAFGTVDAGSPMDDMFDLGATVLFAASGSELERVRGAELDTVTSALPTSLREVIGGCMDPDPSRRPTAEQVVDYLDRQDLPFPSGNWLPVELTAEIEVLAAATESRTVGGKISRRHMIVGLAGGALLIGGAAAATVAFSSEDLSPTPAGPSVRTPSPATSSTGEPTPVILDAPDATKAWTAAGGSAPTYLEASDKVVMIVTDQTTAFVDASTGKPALRALNSTSMFGSNDWSPTTYAGGVFYYLCDLPGGRHTVAAVDGTTGDAKWATSMAMSDAGSASTYHARYVAASGNTVYVCGRVQSRTSSTSEETTGYIRAFDGATGKGLWRVEGTDINNVLVPPSGSHLLAASSVPRGQAGQVQMIDAGKQGARGWKTAIPKAAYYFNTGWPLTCYAAGLFFFAGGSGGTLFAVDAATGVEKWHQPFEANSGDQVRLGSLTASLDGTTIYVPVGSDLAAVSSADGTLKWVARLTGASRIGGSNMFNASLRTTGKSAQCSADTVFVTDTAKTLWAIDAATGKARWKYNDPGQPDLGFKWTVGGDHVFIASNLTLTAISTHGK
ncbi:PQQ-binding-like beta-propeller repeat protein [Amycolatopsis sp. TNS106]|uniref:outer membrane protein assembly factor BamB family protein n=1 Tax=Amycolatopsis sp. TNS106 TaxID=2861750 RepID=UPI001C59BAA1|nr:PQQ-binding-like beta-propeller repeat protein [Amycolatopsis sp. TNS106]